MAKTPIRTFVSNVFKRKKVTSTDLPANQLIKDDESKKKTDIYINIDDISVTPPSAPNQPQTINVKPNAPIYEKSGSSGGKSNFVQTGSAPTSEMLETDKKQKLQQQIASDPAWQTEGGKKLNKELGSLDKENTQYENQIQTRSENYHAERLQYYQDLVNKRKLTVEEANALLNKDDQNYQNALITDENNRRKQRYQEVLDANAVIYIGEFKEIADQTSFTPPKKTTLQKVGDVVKAVYVASPFGTRTRFKETTTENLTAEREKNALNSLLFYGGGTGIIGGTTFKSSLNAVNEERRSQYSAEQQQKLFDEYAKLIENTPPELRYQVQDQALTLMAQKGMKFDEGITEEGVIKLTGSDFERRISQNVFEWEKEREKKGALGEVLLGTRIASTIALETYGLWKGTDFIIGKGVSAYQNYGRLTVEGVEATGTTFGEIILSQTPKATRTVTLSEGIAEVPKNYKMAKVLTGLSLTGLYAVAKVKQYSEYKQMSKYGGEVFWLETVGEIGGIEGASGIGRGGYNYLKNEIANFEIATVKQPDLSQTGFLRMNKLLGYKEVVYMNRYRGVKISSPKSWVQYLQGYRKGQFINRQYKFLPDELTAYYKYGGNVQIFKQEQSPSILQWLRYDKRSSALVFPYKNNPQLIKTINAEAFPYDAKNTHYDWFMRRNIAEFPVPKKSKLPIKINEQEYFYQGLSKRYKVAKPVEDNLPEIISKRKGFGYSATGEEWSATEFSPSQIFYDEGKILNTKGAVQYYSGKGVSGGFLRIFSRGGYESATSKRASSPIIYAGYFDKIKINKAIREISGVDQAGRELKAYLFRKDTGVAGTGNIPLAKREVELTAEIEKRIPIRKKFKIKLEGWSVPVEEQILVPKEQLTTNELKAIVKEMGSVKEVEASQSILPSKRKNRPFVSSNEFSVSRSVKSMERSIASEIGRSSQISRPSSYLRSLISARSGMRSGRSSIASSIFSYPSSIKSSIRSSITSNPPSRKIPPSSLFLLPKLSGKTKKRKLKKNILDIYASLPDFTARSVGLPSPEINIKDVERELRSIKTGGEIRTGARLKW